MTESTARKQFLQAAKQAYGADYLAYLQNRKQIRADWLTFCDTLAQGRIIRPEQQERWKKYY